MAVDFPAAHSMDTEWFAVDAKGHVGIFISGENGMIPRGRAQANNCYDLLNHLRGLRAEDADDPDFGNDLEDGARHGLFIYDYHDLMEMYGPYSRLHEPETPLHVDQLPPGLRWEVKRNAFPKIDFATQEHVQPIEHVDCDFWWDGAIGYLAGDGKTVRPMPGHETEFANFVRDLRKHYPDETKGLVFEGVEDVPPAKTPRRRKKKKDE